MNKLAGSGKSYTCLLKALKYIDDPKSRTIIIRRSYPMLKLSGGLLDESKGIYPHFDGVLGIQAMTWKFPSGATIQFAAIPDNLADWQGLQCTLVLLDEGAEFKQEEILFLMSRLRSAKFKGHMSMMISCNPDRQSFLYDWVSYSLDNETGIPLPSTPEITRYFVNIGGKIEWGSARKELTDKFGEKYPPLSFRFIPMDIFSNPPLLKANPGYLANLLAQSRVNQSRYLHGSWTAIAENSGNFRREWLEYVDYPPTNPIAVVRSWDLASTVPSETNTNPDYSAGVKISRDKLGIYYIEDCIRFRKLTDGVLKSIIDTANRDGKNDCLVTIPRDGGSGGKTANSFYIRTLAEHGIPAKSVVVSGHSGKKQRFLPFCSLAEAGNVKIVRGDWNNEYLTELEYFTGHRNNHDDQVDATSDAFNTLARQVQLPTFFIPLMDQASPIPHI